jgi:hypothetical protein
MKIYVRRNEAVKKITAVVAAVFAIALVGSATWPFPNFWITDSGTPESIIIGEKPYEANALFYIAEDKGFFAGNGLRYRI